MEPCIIFEEPWEVNERLDQLGLTRAALDKVIDAVVTARADCSDLDVAYAPGQLAYIHGNRALREHAIADLDGWAVARSNNVEAIYRSEDARWVVYQNGRRVGRRSASPLSVSPKGPGSERLVELEHGTRELFEEHEDEAQRTIAALRKTAPGGEVWFLFVEVDDEGVSYAELSRPAYVAGGAFGDFLERIILRCGDPIDPLRAFDDEFEGDYVRQEYNVDVSRRG